MYNEKLKEQFLLNYPKRSAATYRVSLEKISELEELYGKDVFNFSSEELNSCFDNFKSKTLAGIRLLVSPVKQYINFANMEGYVTSKIDLSDLFTDNILEQYVWTYANERSYVLRDDIYAFCSRLINPVDQVIPILPFEGIKGEEAFEMINLKFTDIDFGTGETKVRNIKGETREIIISDQRTLDILMAAKQQETYIINNGMENSSKIKEFELDDNPYVIRKMIRGNGDQGTGDPVTFNYVLSKVVRFFKGTRKPFTNEVMDEPFLSDGEFLNLTNIFKSGFFDYCLQLEKERGELNVKDYEEVCVRFGVKTGLVYSYKKQYLAWKKQVGI